MKILRNLKIITSCSVRCIVQIKSRANTYEYYYVTKHLTQYQVHRKLRKVRNNSYKHLKNMNWGYGDKFNVRKTMSVMKNMSVNIHKSDTYMLPSRS